MIGIPLRENLDCGKICQQIQKLINKYIQENNPDPSSLLLSISIKPIIEQTTTRYIEYKPDSPKSQETL